MRLREMIKEVLYRVPPYPRAIIRALNLGYIANFRFPVTFNEKVNARKLWSRDRRYIGFSDKLEAKKLIGDLLGEEFVVPTLAVFDLPTVDQLVDLQGRYERFVLKRTDGSGGIYFVERDDSRERLIRICADYQRLLGGASFGAKKGEWWYGEIKPKVIAELDLCDSRGRVPDDYKFHVFRRVNGESPCVILEVHFDRNGVHTRSFFDSDLNWLNIRKGRGIPSIHTAIARPANYDLMLDACIKVSTVFNYARLDLYNLDGRVYFGELTFAPGSGFVRFESKIVDRWFGQHWLQSEDGTW